MQDKSYKMKTERRTEVGDIRENDVRYLKHLLLHPHSSSAQREGPRFDPSKYFSFILLSIFIYLLPIVTTYPASSSKIVSGPF